MALRLQEAPPLRYERSRPAAGSCRSWAKSTCRPLCVQPWLGQTALMMPRWTVRTCQPACLASRRLRMGEFNHLPVIIALSGRTLAGQKALTTTCWMVRSLAGMLH